jgi:hypothetical protein
LKYAIRLLKIEQVIMIARVEIQRILAAMRSKNISELSDEQDE